MLRFSVVFMQEVDTSKTLKVASAPAAQGCQGKDKGWHELNAVEVVAANSLGYESFSWDRGESPWRCHQPWESLTRQQLYAADVRCATHTHSHTHS